MSKIIILLLGFSLQIQAGVYSQNAKFTLKLENVTVKKVFTEIEKSSEFRFVYKKSDVSTLGKISLDVKSLRVEEILDKCFKNSNISYTVMDKHIVIKKSYKLKDEKKDGYMTGKVIDEKCNPMPGVTVVVQGTSLGVATDKKGKYKIKAKKGDALKFTFVGYKEQLILIKDQEKIDVKLLPETEMLDETTVVAFGDQKKESVVSAITTVKAEKLRSSTGDISTSFAGNIPGMIAWQTGGKPGALTEDEVNTKYYIRGITSFQSGANIDPLILLDGIEVSKLDLARIDPDDIESFNVLKDASATAMYGARGANGVIYVKTKKGKDGDMYTSFRYEGVLSQPTHEIDVVDAKDYMRLYNSAITSRIPGIQPTYSRERINKTLNPKYPSWVYPGNDWYGTLFKDKTINHRYALNARGGTRKVQYYVSLNHNRDEGMIKTDKLNDFDCNINNRSTTFRINLNIDLTKSLKLAINSFNTYDKYSGTVTPLGQAYGLAFMANPVDFAPVYPDDGDHSWPHIRFGGSNTSFNPYAQIHRGFTNRVRYASINQAQIFKKLNSIIKGLELRAKVAYTNNGYTTTSYTNIPAYYALHNYNHLTGDFSLKALNENDADRTLRIGDRISHGQTVMDYQLQLLHTGSYGDHQTSFTAVGQAREANFTAPMSVLQSLPQRNLGLSCRGTYGYKNKYFVEASFGYNGSERFHKSNKMGFFPACGVAWIASSEDFMKSMSSWLSYLKVRASWGQVGNDGVINDPRFVYMENIDLSGIKVPFGKNQVLWDHYNVKTRGNPDTKWEIAEQLNLGVDFKLFGGLFETTCDIYQEVRSNIYMYRSIMPETMGHPHYTLINGGEVRSRGIDMSLKLQHAFSNDFWFIMNGTFTYNKATYKKLEQPDYKNPWQSRIGNDISQQYCYIAEGLFQDWEEIYNSPRQSGEVQPGDIRYRDVDGNGAIDINDAVPAGYPETPRIIYGLNTILNYHNIELGFQFQGCGNRSFWINPENISPFDNNRAVLKAIANDHWTETNQTNKPFWPRLSTRNITYHNPQENYYDADDYGKVILNNKSTYFMRSGKFIRCKNIQIGYYVSKKICSKINLKKLKFYARVDNPFVISDFDVWDVELAGNGFNYPIQRSYTVGLNLNF